jgi:hypothetical protein
MWPVLNFKIFHWASQTLGILLWFSNKNVGTSCLLCGYHMFCSDDLPKLILPS